MAKKLKCPKCERTFSMAAHLARHMNSTHGGGRRKTKKKKARGRKKGPGRPAMRRRRVARRVGRPKGAAGRLGLRNMSLDQLVDVMNAARELVRRRIGELEAAVG